MSDSATDAARATFAAATDEILPLRFQCAGRTLFQGRVFGRVVRAHPSRLDASALTTPPNFDALPQEIHAVQYPALPIDAAAPPTPLLRIGGALRYAPMIGVLRFTRLGPTRDEVYARLPQKGRHEMRRKSRRFAEAFPAARLVVARTKDELVPFLREARALSARTYQERLLDAGMPSGEAFDDALFAAAAHDRVRGYLLRDDATVYAYGYCRAYENDALWFEKTGYAVEHAASFPGAALLHAMVESLCAEARFTLLDFGFGDAQYKKEAATDVLNVARVWWLRPGFGRSALAASHRAFSVVADGAAAAAARLGLKDRLRRAVRKSASR